MELPDTATPKRRRRAHRLIDIFDSMLSEPTPSGCAEWIGHIGANGYGVLKIAGRLTTAHRVAWARKFGPISSGMCVCHKCDNRKCCNVEHLFLGTQLDNIRDCVSKRRHAQGQRFANAKLTNEQVLELRSAYAAGFPTITSLARKFGIQQSIASRAARGLRWSHVGAAVQENSSAS